MACQNFSRINILIIALLTVFYSGAWAAVTAEQEITKGAAPARPLKGSM